MKFKDLDKSVKNIFYGMGFLFLCLFIATGVTINVANDGHEPVIDPNYYEKGLNYEKTLEDIRIMQDEGYAISGSLLEDTYPLNMGDNTIQIHFSKSGTNLDDANITILRERGATFKFNQDYKLEHKGNGIYETNLTVPDLGQWVLTIRATHAGRTLRKILKVVVQR